MSDISPEQHWFLEVLNTKKRNVLHLCATDTEMTDTQFENVIISAYPPFQGNIETLRNFAKQWVDPNKKALLSFLKNYPNLDVLPLFPAQLMKHLGFLSCHWLLKYYESQGLNLHNNRIYAYLANKQVSFSAVIMEYFGGNNKDFDSYWNAWLDCFKVISFECYLFRVSVKENRARGFESKLRLYVGSILKNSIVGYIRLSGWKDNYLKFHIIAQCPMHEPIEKMLQYLKLQVAERGGGYINRFAIDQGRVFHEFQALPANRGRPEFAKKSNHETYSSIFGNGGGHIDDPVMGLHVISFFSEKHENDMIDAVSNLTDYAAQFSAIASRWDVLELDTKKNGRLRWEELIETDFAALEHQNLIEIPPIASQNNNNDDQSNNNQNNQNYIDNNDNDNDNNNNNNNNNNNQINKPEIDGICLVDDKSNVNLSLFISIDHWQKICEYAVQPLMTGDTVEVKQENNEEKAVKYAKLAVLPTKIPDINYSNHGLRTVQKYHRFLTMLSESNATYPGPVKFIVPTETNKSETNQESKKSKKTQELKISSAINAVDSYLNSLNTDELVVFYYWSNFIYVAVAMEAVVRQLIYRLILTPINNLSQF